MRLVIGNQAGEVGQCCQAAQDSWCGWLQEVVMVGGNVCGHER